MTPSQILASAGSVRGGPSGDDDMADGDPHARMAGQQPQQLLPGKSARAGDADADGARACAGRRGRRARSVRKYPSRSINIQHNRARNVYDNSQLCMVMKARRQAAVLRARRRTSRFTARNSCARG